MRAAVLLILGLAAVSALPASPDRIVGGSATTIEQYPYMAVLLSSSTGTAYSHSCGGTIINNRSILSAANCFTSMLQPWQWRCRVGSTFANSGGTVYNSAMVIRHPYYTSRTLDMDFAILQVSGFFTYGNSIGPGTIAGPNYIVPDNASVWATGWGALCFGCGRPEALHHVEIWAVHQGICRERFAELGFTITENMLCAGWWEVGGRDQCDNDAGGPLLHNGVVVGVCSWGYQCATDRYPGVNARVSSASTWIADNA